MDEERRDNERPEETPQGGEVPGPEERKKRWLRRLKWWLLGFVGLVVLAAAGYFAGRYILIRVATSHKPDYTVGEWFDIAPEGIVSANGEPVTTRMRVGSAQGRVMVLFYGGGVSINEETARHPYTSTNFLNENGFYTPDIDGQIPDLCDAGLGSTLGNNPFRNWTVIIIPYTTADFHIGTADYAYTDNTGEDKILHHHGYTNYRAIMDIAADYVEGPVDELLVTGCSAGGFGAAMLTEDLIENYFPEVPHATLCVDSSCMDYDKWAETARDMWGAPEELVEVMTSRNLIVDFMSHLYQTYGDRLSYLYVGSVRDGTLARYQSYLLGSDYRVDNLQGDLFARDLKTMIQSLQRAVPTLGVYLFDNLPYSIRPNQLRLTQHTIIVTRTVFWNVTDRTPVARWIAEAIGGNTRSHGLNLLIRV